MPAMDRKLGFHALCCAEEAEVKFLQFRGKHLFHFVPIQDSAECSKGTACGSHRLLGRKVRSRYAQLPRDLFSEKTSLQSAALPIQVVPFGFLFF